MKNLIIIILCLVYSTTLSALTKYYVNVNGPGLSGSSWMEAASDLQEVIDKASSGDSVFVAVGTYYGGFKMKEGVIVYGGYTANNDNPSERYDKIETLDPTKQSILDGRKQERVLTQEEDFAVKTVWDRFVIQNGKPSVGEFRVGSLIYSAKGENEIAGVLYKYDPESGEGMMIAADELRKQWGGYQAELISLAIIGSKEDALNDMQGGDNTTKIVGELGESSLDFGEKEHVLNGNYAAYWCDTLTMGGYTDWYLPSAGEFQEVYKANINSVLKGLGTEMTNRYWASAQAGNLLAWSFYFERGYLHPAIKYIEHKVRPVHSFYSSSASGSIYTAGGGVFLKSQGTLKDCIVKDNESSSRGGGVYVGRGGELINCLVQNNKAPEGKEIYYEVSTGISNPVKSGQIQVYPNPVRKGEAVYLKLDNENTSSLAYQFINTGGTVISKGIVNNGESYVKAPMQDGIYILTINTGHSDYRSKIIVY